MVEISGNTINIIVLKKEISNVGQWEQQAENSINVEENVNEDVVETDVIVTKVIELKEKHEEIGENEIMEDENEIVKSKENMHIEYEEEYEIVTKNSTQESKELENE